MRHGASGLLPPHVRPPAAARPPDPCHWIYCGRSGGRPARHQFRHPALCRSLLPPPAVGGPAAPLVGGLPPAAPLSAAHERSAALNSGPPAASHSSRGGFEAQREIASSQRSGGPAKARRCRRKRQTGKIWYARRTVLWALPPPLRPPPASLWLRAWDTHPCRPCTIHSATTIAYLNK